MSYPFQMAELYRKDDNLLDVFGLVLYTDANPHVKKVLADDDYWKALDEISGPLWAIFAIEPRQGRYVMPHTRPGFMAYMVMVWKEPSENKKIIKEFELNSTEKLPLFVVFCQTPEGEILRVAIPINDDSMESAYKSLKDAIELVVMSLQQVLPENKKSGERVYYIVENQINEYLRWQKVKKGLNLMRWINGIVPSVK